METAMSSSLDPKEDDKPVIVRVKRKASHSVLDAFWLEINERPLKRTLFDFENLSISGSLGKVEKLRTKTVLVKYVKSKDSSLATSELMQSFMESTCSEGSLESKPKNEDRRSDYLKRKNIQEEILSKARETKEVFAKNARFQQISRSRRGNKFVNEDEALHGMYQLYDVVRVDEEEKSTEIHKEEVVSLEDQRMLCSYLPLLREYIPNAAEEIESDITASTSQRGVIDDYVYDYYVMQKDVDMTQQDASSIFPLVQVDELEDFYDGPDSEYGSDDSNAENNPMNDYPDESSDDEDIESEETNSGQEEDEEEGDEEKGDEEEESATNNSSGEDRDPLFEDEDEFDLNGDDIDYDDSEDDIDKSGFTFTYR